MSKGRTYNTFRLLVRSHVGIDLKPEVAFHPTRKWRFDFACEKLMLAIEIEGGVWSKGRHTRPQGYTNDLEKYNNAVLLGWRVLRFTPEQLLTSSTLETIQKAKNFEHLGVK